MQLPTATVRRTQELLEEYRAKERTGRHVIPLLVWRVRWPSSVTPPLR